ncbi:hypothetical protein [Streptomyces sp. NRRL WC-3549]|nr:hypothetical protein [Streptomyces sp. NRRL WC-3549]
MPQIPTDAQVKPGTGADLTALTDVSNRYARETPLTCDPATSTPEARRP